MLDIIPTGKITCPICRKVADFGDFYLGGYGWHKAYRCPAGHGGPLFADLTTRTYMPGHYTTHWFHGSDIVRAAVMNTSQEQEK